MHALMFAVVLPPFHFPNLEQMSRGGAQCPQLTGIRGYHPENFWNSLCDLVHFDAIWWQLFVLGRRTRCICNCAIKIEPIPAECIILGQVLLF